MTKRLREKMGKAAIKPRMEKSLKAGFWMENFMVRGFCPSPMGRFMKENGNRDNPGISSDTTKIVKLLKIGASSEN